MPTSMSMPPDALETLQQVNDELRSALLNFRPERKHCSAIKPQDFSDILSQLLRAAECLRRPLPHSDDAAALENEALEYRRNLEKLKHFLPDVQGRLLAEKVRLETARTHVASAMAWARARKKTL
ncbi:MAG TPA: hypothetical protein VJX69_01950 [Terriglobales bacterium]|nr:hypothetical protein [Terriglobales bacterium]